MLTPLAHSGPLGGTVMSKLFVAAAALAATLAQPAAAVTFSTLTTIYVGAGVKDSGGGALVGVASSFSCANVSGANAVIRFLVLNSTGGVAAAQTQTLPHGFTATASTHDTAVFSDSVMNSGTVSPGVVNIESTESGIFCTAVVVDAANATPLFMGPIHLVRVNPHPGTLE